MTNYLERPELHGDKNKSSQSSEKILNLQILRKQRSLSARAETVPEPIKACTGTSCKTTPICVKYPDY